MSLGPAPGSFADRRMRAQMKRVQHQDDEGLFLVTLGAVLVGAAAAAVLLLIGTDPGRSL